MAVLILWLWLPPGLPAGTLDTFEKDVTSPKKTSGAAYSDPDDDDSFADFVVDVFVHVLSEGGSASWQRTAVSADSLDTPWADLKPRQTGERFIPLLRLEGSYQVIKSDVDAWDMAGTVGYGCFGVFYGRTAFRETDPDDTLTLTRVYGLYRMTLGSGAEVDLGLGQVTLEGDSLTTRMAFTLPVLVSLSESVGLEIRPAWMEGLSEYDLALLFGKRYASLRLGYRWTLGPSESLGGPHAGLAIHF